MRDDKIQTFGRRAFEHVHGGHHRDRDPPHRAVRVAGFEGVDRIRFPREADLLLYLGHDFAGGDLLLLPTSRSCSRQDDGKHPAG